MGQGGDDALESGQGEVEGGAEGEVERGMDGGVEEGAGGEEMDEKPLYVILWGAPGVGKTTQAGKLAERYAAGLGGLCWE